MMGTSIETAAGMFFDFLAPRPEDVCVGDIARALSMTCRFGGHVERFYSVAEHALLVHAIVVGHFNVPRLAPGALHHDSHEAYLGDIPTPLKRLLGDKYDQLAYRVDTYIADALGLNPWSFTHPIIKEADALALRIEAEVLKPSRGLGEHWGHTEPPPIQAPWRLGMSPAVAEATFLSVHEQELHLTGHRDTVIRWSDFNTKEAS